MLPKLLTSIFGSRNDRLLKQYQRGVVRINALEAQFEGLDDAALRAKTDEFRQRVAQGATLDDLLAEAFAVAREACKRTLKCAISTCSWLAAWRCIRERSPKCAPARARR